MTGERRPPTGGEVVTGIFLAVVGVLFVLTGGGCTLVWIALLFEGNGPGAQAILFAAPFVLICLGVAFVGFLALKGAVAQFRGAPAQRPARHDALPPDESAQASPGQEEQR